MHIGGNGRRIGRGSRRGLLMFSVCGVMLGSGDTIVVQDPTSRKKYGRNASFREGGFLQLHEQGLKVNPKMLRATQTQ